MAPAVRPTINMRGIQCPPFIAAGRNTLFPLHARLGGGWGVPDQPAPLLPSPAPLLPIDDPLVTKAQARPNAPVAIGRMFLNQLLNARNHLSIGRHCVGRRSV